MARLLTGREAASALTEELKGRTALLARQGVTPKLVILRCGENEADGAYLRGALKRGALCGVEVEVRTLPDTASRQQLLDAIDAVNADSTVHGCLLLRPLPPHLRDAEPEICDRLLPEKDVDGMTGTSAAGVYLGRPLGFAPLHGGGGDGTAGVLRRGLRRKAGGGYRPLSRGGTACGHASAGAECHGDGVPHRYGGPACRHPRSGHHRVGGRCGGEPDGISRPTWPDGDRCVRELGCGAERYGGRRGI